MKTTPKGKCRPPSHGRHDKQLLCKLETIERTLNRIERKLRIMSIVGDETKAYAVKIDAQTSSIGASTVRISETLAALEGKLAEAGTVEEVREILSPTVEALAKVGAELELVGKKPEVLLSKK